MPQPPSITFLGYAFFIPSEKLTDVFRNLVANFTDEEHEKYLDAAISEHDGIPVNIESLSEEEIEKITEEQSCSLFNFIENYIEEYPLSRARENTLLDVCSYGWDRGSEDNEGIAVYVKRTAKSLAWYMDTHGDMNVEKSTNEEIAALKSIRDKFDVDYPIGNKHWSYQSDEN